MKYVCLVPHESSQPEGSFEELVELLPVLLPTDWLEEASQSEQREDVEQLREAVKQSREFRCEQYRDQYEDHPLTTEQPSRHLVVGSVYGVRVSFTCSTEELPKFRPGLCIGQGIFLPLVSFHLEKVEIVVSFQALDCVFEEKAPYASQYFIPSF